MARFDEFDEKTKGWLWLLIGLVFALFSYGQYNTAFAAWLFLIFMLRFFRTADWKGLIAGFVGIVIVLNFSFAGVVPRSIHCC